MPISVEQITEFIKAYGANVAYVVLFVIVFAESGLFFGFFLPGDSLLLTAGLLASPKSPYDVGFNIWVLVPLLFIAACGLRSQAADATNEAGGKAYAFRSKHALAQYAVTGCLNGTYYASAATQLERTLELACSVDPAFASGDPFFWLNPENGGLIARNIARGLGELRPSSRAMFMANAEAFQRALAKDIQRWKTALKPLHGVKVFTAQCGWQNFSSMGGPQFLVCKGTPGELPSPQTLLLHIKQMKADDKWTDGQSPFGLPKTRIIRLVVGKKKKKKTAEDADKTDTKAAKKK